ncbi:MAG: carboxylating nicotinate-nucleotide diphosphorylase [Oscillospiraceae bacterium]|jgi:nicotinate-nucleotide pyrophosphorylase (carboxylating)|nr:carboxylating nicotinate-nucleotide diphosphorylase [Oscillospiraceae bacterium]
MIPWFTVDELLRRALQEDVNYLDLSCAFLFAPGQRSSAYLLAKAPGVLCGAEIFVRVFQLLDDSLRFTLKKHDGEAFAAGDILLELEGETALLLQGERTALNLLQHLCGVATQTAQIVALVRGTGAQIADTRKTLPGLRALQKYAVLCGGGKNHRFNLSDGVMLKDNHIDACGSIEAAVRAVRTKLGHMVRLEVETRSLDEVRQALAARADVIMLDNMPLEEMRQAVRFVRAKAENSATVLEASGDINAENVRQAAETGVDVISIGALTHSAKALNISMRLETGA